jgi:hypothetical protein
MKEEGSMPEELNERDRRFRSLPRRQQRFSLLIRLGRQRREIEQWLTDVEAFEEILKRRGENPLDLEAARADMIGRLAQTDQQIEQIRDSP